MMPENQYIFDDLKLLPGAKLDLRSDQYAFLKGIGVYIGCLSKKSIIVSTPAVNGVPISCKPGNKLVVRLFVNHLNCACAFRTEIVHIAVSPYPHLFLSIPDDIEVGAVRNSIRANVNLPCLVTSSAPYRKKNQPVFITNLSIDGAKIESADFMGEPGEAISLVTKIKVLGMETTVNIQGIIRSFDERGEAFTYGVQFLDIDDLLRLNLYAYVLSEIMH
jgi:hypothetical protein